MLLRAYLLKHEFTMQQILSGVFANMQPASTMPAQIHPLQMRTTGLRETPTRDRMKRQPYHDYSIARYPMEKEATTTNPFRCNTAGILGYACWWALHCLVLLTPLFAQSHTNGQMLDLDFNSMTVLSGAAISLLVGIPKKTLILNYPNATLVIAVASIVAGALLPSVSLTPESSTVLVPCGGFLVGVGISLLQIIWGFAFFSRLTFESIYIATIAPIILGVLVAFVIFLFGRTVSIVCCLLLPFVTAGFLKPMMDEAVHKPSTHSSSSPNRLIVAPICLTTCFGFAFGIFRTILLPTEAHFTTLTFGLTALACLAVSLLILIVSPRLSRSTRVPSVLGLTLFAVTTAVFILSLLEADGKAIAQSIITGGFRCVDIITWIMLMLAFVASPDHDTIRALALWRGLGCLGCFVGYTLGDAVVANGIIGSIGLVPPSILLLLFLMIATMASLYASRRTEGMIDSAGNSSATMPAIAYADIAQRYGLSDREAQVFDLLCTGRSVPAIAEKLVIAPSTVTTHVQRIYRKLGVHSKQELIDLVESIRQKKP